MTSLPFPFVRLGPDGEAAPIERAIAIERPIAIEFNGIGYAVMMATPADLQDFATGFALSERLVDAPTSILDIDVHATPDGDVVRVTLAPDCSDRLLERVRHRVSESSCGLCGIENLGQALRPLPRISTVSSADATAVFRALAGLRDRQLLNRATGAVHAAALCSSDGEVIELREDVGRHNAFDKLLGAMARGQLDWDGGFALLSSRCSYELVEKAALANCPLLVTISAATDLAISRAAKAGLRLIMLARSDAMLAVPA